MTYDAGRADFDVGASTDRLDRDLQDAEAAIRKSGAAAEQAFGRQATGAIAKTETRLQSLTGKLRGMAGSGGIGGALLGGVGLGAGLGVFGLITSGVGKVVDAVGDAINAASDMAETQSKLDAVFVRSASTMRAWASGSAESMGLSQQAALEAAATLGNFTQAMGLAEPEAADLSKTLVQLASDLASFNNEDPTAVLEALRSGLSGEAEPLRKFGISISAARVDALLLADGVKKVNGAFTDGDKVMARYKLIMQDTTTAQGDFARTSDGLANRQRILDAKFADVQARLGTGLIPAAEWATRALGDLAKAVGVLTGGASTGSLDGARRALGLLTDELGDAAAATEKANAEWVGSGTILDSAIDGAHALQDAVADVGLSPKLTELRAWRAELSSMATAMHVSTGELDGFIREAQDAGKTLEETREAVRRLWESATSGEQERQRNAFEAFFGGVADAAETGADDVTHAVHRIEHQVAGMPTSLKATIRAGRKDVREAMTDLRWAMEHPFAGERYVNYLKSKQEAAQRKLNRALRQGKTEAAREAGLLVDAIQAELDRLRYMDFSVNVTLDTFGRKLKNAKPSRRINAPSRPGQDDEIFAAGGTVRRSGWKLVGEEGPELALLPSGTRVYSHRQSARMLDMDKVTAAMAPVPTSSTVHHDHSGTVRLELAPGTASQLREAGYDDSAVARMLVQAGALSTLRRSPLDVGG